MTPKGDLEAPRPEMNSTKSPVLGRAATAVAVAASLGLLVLGLLGHGPLTVAHPSGVICLPFPGLGMVCG